MICPFRKKYSIVRDIHNKVTEVRTEFGDCYEECCPFFIPADDEYGRDICARVIPSTIYEDPLER